MALKYNYNKANLTAEVCGIDSGDTTARIPNTVEYYKKRYTVTSIKSCSTSSLESITIPESVTTIAETAFCGCENLKEFKGKYSSDGGRCLIVNKRLISYANMSGTTYNIPSYVTEIGISPFNRCSNLESITIPENVTEIGDYAFLYCRNLKEFKGKYSSDGGRCLIVNKRLISYANMSGTTYNIPSYVTEIGTGAFCDCSSLESITIPSSVTQIGKKAFCGCSSLESITIPESVVQIGDGAFGGCSSLKSITIPSSVTQIGKNAFSGCSSLKSVTIPSSVTQIGDFAFYDCRSLMGVTIPNSVTQIGDFAFCDCSSLESITIPESVVQIGDVAFSRCSSLKSITIPKSVKQIGDRTFSRCSSLKSITIPSSVTQICNSAFYGCRSLESITIPESVVQIGDFAFCDCSSLESITIPSSVTQICKSAFSGCSSLESITIPESVVQIGDDAFHGCSSLKSVTIPSSVTQICKSAFSGCRSLESATIPNSVTQIGDWAFCLCISLKSITIPKSVKQIGDRTFCGCSSLKSVSIPNSVTRIGDYAFNRHSNGECGVEVVNIYNDEGNVIIHPDAFTKSVKINYLGVNNEKYSSATIVAEVAQNNSVESVEKQKPSKQSAKVVNDSTVNWSELLWEPVKAELLNQVKVKMSIPKGKPYAILASENHKGLLQYILQYSVREGEAIVRLETYGGEDAKNKFDAKIAASPAGHPLKDATVSQGQKNKDKWAWAITIKVDKSDADLVKWYAETLLAVYTFMEDITL